MADDQVNVQVTADATQLEQQFAQAVQAVQASLDKLHQSIDATNTSIGNLGANGPKQIRPAKQATDEWAKAMASLQNTFEKSISGMILGTTTWQKTVRQLAQMALKDLIDLSIKDVMQWTLGEETKTGATEAGAAARNAAEATGQSQGLATTLENVLKSIGGKAAESAANVYASVSEIPYVGWVLAPIAAAAAFAAVMAFGGKIPSAAGGLWNVPSDTLAMVHKQETIIPAAIAQPMRDFFSGGAASGGGSSYAITIQAIDTQTGAQFLMNNAPLIAKSLAREMRNNNSLFR